MRQAKPSIIYLKDYESSAFQVQDVKLMVDLHEDQTLVTSDLTLKRQSNSNQPLILYGEQMELMSIKLDNESLSESDYQLTGEQLTINDCPEQFVLQTVVAIKPQLNKALSGLYKSNNAFCTQCESHGFRRITYYPDRPDILSHFTTTITADKVKYPYLLSNGNLIDSKDLGNGRHQVTWQDPSLKPPYLFALVAGNFDVVEDKFITMNNREVKLQVFVESGKKSQAEYAIGALKRAMKWDEQNYRREYDLDIYMIVAVSDFNFGAMENKGLNIFNDRYILANQQTATDADFVNVESVIGHEYFHNWSGNRVTVRDWFQITLKEGLTIFRDQSFTQDMQSPVVKRIQDVNFIRTHQFAQDAGPMAHPIRPDHYIEINNFYTVTVYHKGAEVIRMLQTLVGKEKFRQALEYYFDHYDGQAITTEEFLHAIEHTANIDLAQFRRWYTQAGTPMLTIKDKFSDGMYTLEISQSCSVTPDQQTKENFHIPLAIGLLDQQGKELPLISDDIDDDRPQILNIKDKTQKFSFKVSEKPIPSILRNFSAPVKINYDYSLADLSLLMKHDSDLFNRWDAGQKLATKVLLDLVNAYQPHQSLTVPEPLIDAYQYVLLDHDIDKSLQAEMLQLPSEAYLHECMTIVDVDAVHAVRQLAKQQIAIRLLAQFEKLYHDLANDKFSLEPAMMGRRKLKNLCLEYITSHDNEQYIELAFEQFKTADNMTDRMGALIALNDCQHDLREEALAIFYHDWQSESLVINKWFTLQAISGLPNRLAAVRQLMHHPAFDIKNPNKARALIGSYCQFNHVQFHQISGEGYQFLAEQILLIDPVNPQLAARLVEPLINWRKFDQNRQAMMRQVLENISTNAGLSKDVYELVSKSLL